MKAGGTSDSSYPLPHRPNEPGRKFLPLGATSHRAQVSKGLTPKPSPSVFTASFISRETPSSPPVTKLPDIYTTCPELRQFKPIMNLPDMTIGDKSQPGAHLFPQRNDANDDLGQKQNNNGNSSKFDPTESILKPYVFIFFYFMGLFSMLI